MIDGTWRPTEVWGGLGSGMFRMAPYTNMTPEEVSEAERIREAIATGRLHPFEGPITRQDGTVVIPAGQTVSLAFTADNPGLWALHSLVAERADGGLIGTFTVAE